MTATTMNHAGSRSPTTPADRLRQIAAVVRVSFMWLGVRKTLTREQKSQAAEAFGAEGDVLSAGKKLLDTKHPAFKAVTAVRGRAVTYWKDLTLPFPEPGFRLIRQEDIEPFNRQMVVFRGELMDAVVILDNHYTELKTAARARLGQTHNPADYPESLLALFDLMWEFPNVQPPEYLLQLNPAIYEQEKARVASRFDEAVHLAEHAFLSEFAEMVSHLCERLGDDSDGDKKIFRDSAVTNLVAFFERFRWLNVNSNQQLDNLVTEAQSLVRGVEPQALRANDVLRQHMATQLSRVQSRLDGMLVDPPRRSIIRNRPTEGGSS